MEISVAVGRKREYNTIRMRNGAHDRHQREGPGRLFRAKKRAVRSSTDSDAMLDKPEESEGNQ